MKVFGVVGWKNNGKTTLVERLVAHLTAPGYRVSTVKHAHHEVDLDQPGKDSWRHREAGAARGGAGHRPPLGGDPRAARRARAAARRAAGADDARSIW